MASPKPKADSYESFSNEFYQLGSEDHFWMAGRMAAVHGLMRELKIDLSARKEVLDVGCGTGTFGVQLEKVSHWNVTGAELNAEAIRLARSLSRKVEAYDVSWEEKRFLNKFDVITLMDVLEHIEHPKDFIQSCLKHLKPGGHFVVNVPALPSLFSQFDVVQGHHLRYTKASLREAFSGVDILDVRYWGFSLLPIAVLRKMWVSLLPSDKVYTSGFKAPGRMVNTLFDVMLKAENTLVSQPPLGTSVLLAGVKREKVGEKV